MRRWRLSAVVYMSKSSNCDCGNDVRLKQGRATPKQKSRVKESSLENIPSCETFGRRAAARVIRDWLACLGLIKSGAHRERASGNYEITSSSLSSHSSCQGAVHLQYSLDAASLPGTRFHQRSYFHLIPAPDSLLQVHHVPSYMSCSLSYRARCSTCLRIYR